MSNRAFLILASIAIVLFVTFVLVDKYEQCLVSRPAKECPALGPFISKYGTTDVRRYLPK